MKKYFLIFSLLTFHFSFFTAFAQPGADPLVNTLRLVEKDTANYSGASYEGRVMRANGGQVYYHDGYGWKNLLQGGVSGLGSTDNSVLRTNGTSGGSIQNSPVTIDDSGNISMGLSTTAGASRTISAVGSATNIALGLYTKGSGDLNLVTLANEGAIVTTSSKFHVDFRAAAADPVMQIWSRATNGAETGRPFRLYHSRGVGTGTAGNILGLAYNMELAGGNLDVAYVDTEATVATAASESVDLAFKLINAGSIGEKMRIESTGDVGIGQTNPDHNIHITGRVANDNLFLAEEDGGVNIWRIYEAAAVSQIEVSGSVGSAKHVLTSNSTTGAPAWEPIVDQASASTAGATITLDCNSQVQRSFVGSATFAAAKAIALSNTTNTMFFNFFFEVTNVAAVLTVPSDWGMATVDFDGADWTPPATGKYEMGGSFDDTNNVWYVKISGPFTF